NTLCEKVLSKLHLSGKFNIPIRYSLPNRAGWLLDYEKDILLIASLYEVDTVKRALESIGLDNVFAFASPEIIDQSQDIEQYKVESPEAAQEKNKKDAKEIIDVRNQDEWDEGNIPGARHIMSGYRQE